MGSIMSFESTVSKSDAKESTLSMGVYCVYRVTNVGGKVSIKSIFSIVSRRLCNSFSVISFGIHRKLDERLWKCGHRCARHQFFGTFKTQIQATN